MAADNVFQTKFLPVPPYLQSFQKVEGNPTEYLSSDSTCKSDEDTELQSEWFTTEFLNDITCSEIPNHKIILKEGAPITLLRNIDQATGLCIGTRLIVADLGTNVIKATVITGTNIGEDISIPRMDMVPSVSVSFALGNSDPEKLKESAQAHQRLSPNDIQKRQKEIKELFEKMRMPSDAELMKVAISDLNNVSTSLEDRHRALQELGESIDNANDDERGVDGLPTEGLEITHFNLEGARYMIYTPSDPLFFVALKDEKWILQIADDVSKLSPTTKGPGSDSPCGKASKNNPIVQQQVLELGVLSRLIIMVKSDSTEEANKALYTVSALILNNLASQALFYAEAGGSMLQDILRNASVDVRLRRKAVLLLADLAEYQLEHVEEEEPPFFNDQDLLKSVVDLTKSTELDLQEKALVAIKSLLQLRTTEARVFKDFCALGDALSRMRQLLHDLMANEYQRDYLMDVENLRIEVEHILGYGDDLVSLSSF
ncbi:uncharacterized protein LOC130736275 [Lotus japonicus]|uniref:uncharacterized protein LOC130736275 n=1 Tax=Lotus japonicus TaxID=34305 RepID=UPI00258725BE|nr:uncharacterized protein LOC130736275 [Lotus japonicus]